VNAIGRLTFAERGHFSVGDGALVHLEAAVRVDPFDSGQAHLPGGAFDSAGDVVILLAAMDVAVMWFWN
jgi:hypothetical protein